MKATIRVRFERYHPETHEVTGEAKTKLGRGPWSYWLRFCSDADEIAEEVPSLAARVLPPKAFQTPFARGLWRHGDFALIRPLA